MDRRLHTIFVYEVISCFAIRYFVSICEYQSWLQIPPKDRNFVLKQLTWVYKSDNTGDVKSWIEIYPNFIGAVQSNCPTKRSSGNFIKLIEKTSITHNNSGKVSAKSKKIYSSSDKVLTSGNKMRSNSSKVTMKINKMCSNLGKIEMYHWDNALKISKLRSLSLAIVATTMALAHTYWITQQISNITSFFTTTKNRRKFSYGNFRADNASLNEKDT